MMIVMMMIMVVVMIMVVQKINFQIIDFALTGTDSQLGEPFKELTMRYICRLPWISYNNRDTARSGCFSLRKLCKELAHTEIIQRDNSQPQMDKGVGWAVVCWGWNLVLCYQCMVERTRKQLKYTYLHPFVNRQSKNSLANVVLLTQIRNHGGTTGNFDIFGLCLWNRFFSSLNPMDEVTVSGEKLP